MFSANIPSKEIALLADVVRAGADVNQVEHLAKDFAHRGRAAMEKLQIAVSQIEDVAAGRRNATVAPDVQTQARASTYARTGGGGVSRWRHLTTVE